MSGLRCSVPLPSTSTASNNKQQGFSSPHRTLTYATRFVREYWVQHYWHPGTREDMVSPCKGKAGSAHATSLVRGRKPLPHLPAITGAGSYRHGCHASSHVPLSSTSTASNQPNSRNSPSMHAKPRALDLESCVEQGPQHVGRCHGNHSLGRCRARHYSLTCHQDARSTVAQDVPAPPMRCRCEAAAVVLYPCACASSARASSWHHCFLLPPTMPAHAPPPHTDRQACSRFARPHNTQTQSLTCTHINPTDTRLYSSSGPMGGPAVSRSARGSCVK